MLERIEAGGVLLGLLRRVDVHEDHRGSVREQYRASWFPEVPPVVQLVHSESKPNTLRGMHLHRKQWDVWHFTTTAEQSMMRGFAKYRKVVVRLYDHTTGGQAIVELEDDDVLAIPPGISHGFYAENGGTLVYALTNEYDGSDEFGWFPFDGAEGESRWPSLGRGLLVSERDLRAPRLAEFTG